MDIDVTVEERHGLLDWLVSDNEPIGFCDRVGSSEAVANYPKHSVSPQGFLEMIK